MDLKEFIEAYYGIKLLPHQEGMLRLITPECTDACKLVPRSNRYRTWYVMEHHHSSSSGSNGKLGGR